ncbi:hypothetical protein RJZ57_003616 [Blastomyces gilchristii]
MRADVVTARCFTSLRCPAITAMTALQDRIANPTLCTISVLGFLHGGLDFVLGTATWSKSDHHMAPNVPELEGCHVPTPGSWRFGSWVGSRGVGTGAGPHLSPLAVGIKDPYRH